MLSWWMCAAAGEPNRLTFGEGTSVVLAEPPAEMFGHVAFDGSTQTRSIGIPRRAPLPLSVVLELPALTTLQRFELADFNDYGTSEGRHVSDLTIEGSTQSATEGFTPLVQIKLKQGIEGSQSFAVPAPRPVRWVRFTATKTHQPATEDFRPHNFTEIAAYGLQADRGDGARFSGRWRVRRKGLNDTPGDNLIELQHDGGAVRGCEVVGGRHNTIAGSIDARCDQSPSGRNEKHECNRMVLRVSPLSMAEFGFEYIVNSRASMGESAWGFRVPRDPKRPPPFRPSTLPDVGEPTRWNQ